ncbi:MAG: methyltransferase domain-containing protein [Phycisphaerales bacterium]|nr:methyltransferase domain-containing protein [Phycisphaerales bacterium]
MSITQQQERGALAEVKHAWRFVREFTKDPSVIGAVWPSSPALAKAMTEGVGLERAREVFEIGPGAGAITAGILPRLTSTDVYLGVERTPAMVQAFRRRFPDLEIFEGSAEDLLEIARSRSWAPGTVDAVISGLPWAAFDRGLQDRILDAVLGVLRPGGYMTTMAYTFGRRLEAGRRFEALIRSRFSAVDPSPVVWRNLPPAIVYRCRK